VLWQWRPRLMHGVFGVCDVMGHCGPIAAIGPQCPMTSPTKIMEIKDSTKQNRGGLALSGSGRASGVEWQRAWGIIMGSCYAMGMSIKAKSFHGVPSRFTNGGGQFSANVSGTATLYTECPLFCTVLHPISPRHIIQKHWTKMTVDSAVHVLGRL
jgi:hypothetical protein